MLIEFCLPIYNEEKIARRNILRLLKYCRKQKWDFSWHIILLVNGSGDSSCDISKDLSGSNPDEITYYDFPEAGRGRALKKYYLQSQADILIYMDIDLAVSLDNIPGLIAPLVLDEADIVIGSRLLPESKIERSTIRELSSQGYNFLSRIILHNKFSDLQCGFKAVKNPVFKKLAPNILDDKWFFDTELVAFGHQFNYRIKEIPVNWSENRWDERKSKVKIFSDSLKFFFNLLFLKYRISKFKLFEANDS